MLYAIDLSDANQARKLIEYEEHDRGYPMSRDQKRDLLEAWSDWPLGYIGMIVEHMERTLR